MTFAFEHDVDLRHLLVIMGAAVRVDVGEMHGGELIPIFLKSAARLSAGTRSRRDFIELCDGKAWI